MSDAMELLNLYYRQNRDVPEYMDILLATNKGIFRPHGQSVRTVDQVDSRAFSEWNQIEKQRRNIGPLFIEEVRATEDSNMYILLSGKIILAIEYILNSNFDRSTQEMRIIDALDGANKDELDFFNELDLISF